MAITRVDELKQRIGEALGSADFQVSAQGLTGASLTSAVTRFLKNRNIGVTLVSVERAEKAALADFAAVWKSSSVSKQETNWFSVKAIKR